MSGEMTRFLQHNRIRLALHELRSGTGRALLLLHGLGERSPTRVPGPCHGWRGPIFSLDFTGHGASTVPRGGGYMAELLMGDVDVALAELGQATVLGRGLGGYVALLIAGGRPTQVRGAILCDGPGFAGGGSGSTSPFVPDVDSSRPAPPDPFALIELATDIRPPDYAAVFARQAARLSGIARPISLCATERPGWLSVLVEEMDIARTSIAESLSYYGGVE